MFSYESGLILATLLWLWTTISALVVINSRMERNLNRIGQSISWLTLKPEPILASEIHQSQLRKSIKFLLIYGIGLFLVLGSWIYVASFVAMIIHRMRMDSGAPQAIKDFRWKLKNTDMTFDQLIKEMMKVGEQDPAKFEEVKSQMIDNLRDRGIHIA